MARQQIHGDDLADATIERGNRLGGLTIRAEFAKAAMTGFCSNGDRVQNIIKAGFPPNDVPRLLATAAVEQADALIAALNKED